MDESTNKAIEETNANAVDSSSIISEKLKETVASAAAAAAAEVVSSTTPAIGLLNGETTNGIYKAEQMDVDTEDESQIFSENGISQSTDDIIIKKNVTDDISSGKNKNDEELKMNTEEEEEDSLVSPKYEDIRSPNSSPLAEAMDTSEIKTTEEVKCNDIQIENDGIEKNKEDTILESNPSCDGNNVESDIENSKQNGSKEKDTVLVSTNENQIEEEKKTTSKVVENDKNDDSGESRDSFSKKNGTVDINNKQLPSKCKSEETSTELPTSQDDGNEVGVVDDDKDNGDVKLPNKNDIVNVEDLDIKEVSKNGNDQPEPMDVSDSISINGAEGCESVKNKNNNENEKTEQESSKENNDLVKETTEDVKEPDDKKEKVDNENVINGLTTKSGKNVDSKIHIIALDDDDVEEVEKPSSSTSVVASKNDNCVQDEKMDVDTSPGKLSIVKEKESVVEESVVIGSDSETEMDTDNQTKKIEDPLSDQLSSTVTVTSTTPTQEAKTSISPLEDTVTTLSTSESIIAPAPVLVSASVSPTASVSSSASVSALPLESASTSTSASAPASASASALSLAELPLVKQLSSELITQILSITSSTILSPTPNVTNVIAPPTLTSIQNDAPKSNLLKYPQKPDDDDDDDCVVIEDDDDNNMPIPKTMTNIRNFASLKDDMSIGDDSQPPAKKQKITINNNSNITQIGQITIKDARSLMPHSTNETSFQQTFANNIKAKEAPGLVIIEAVSNNPQALKQNLGIVTDSLLTSPKTGEANRNIYPINLRVVNATSTNVSLSPPKLVPVSNSVVGVSSLSNADLLPGLTDDMFVLEAPSFIVPYIYEKPPSDNLREIIAKIIEQYELKKELESQLPDSNLDENKANEDKSTTSTSDALISTSVPSTTSADLGAAALSAITSSPQPSIATSTITTGSSSTAEENKGNKKKSSSYTGDESWAESEDSDEEDEDSENETRTKVLIKEATDDLDAIKEVIKPNTPIINTSSVPGDKSDNYFDSPLGKFFLDIGVGLVQEFVQVDLLRLQKKKLRKCQKQSNANKTELENAIQALGCNLETSRKKNAPFKFERKRCEFCNFKSESLLSMANHYEAPHQNGVMYRCNFCPYEIRSSHDIIFHMETMHNIQGRIEKSLSYNQCPLCPFEDNGKSRFARHIPTCVKKYRPEVNLAPPHDWEGPAKIPRIKPRHGLVGTATAYQAMAAQAAAQKAAIAALQLQQQQQHARNLSPLTQNNVNAAKLVRRPQTTTNKTSASLLRVNQPTGVNRQPPPTAATTTTTNMMLPNNYQISGGQLIQVSASGLAILPNSQNTLTLQSSNAKKTTTTGQPSISITPLPRQPTSSSSSSSTIKTQNNTIKPGQGIAGNKASFVICEICDGYIKDLEQLRNHMQWMHKVKIHPKMIYNRPPLNCQKCQFRFFTDQGLERHLLGSHGLVTSSMQEAANKGKDAGRCPVCGRMYQWKLLNHVSRDHHMTLKPAHLSYKCTVCTATFGMYKQFENHVYTAHSTVAKKAMDNKKSSTNSNSNNNTGNNNNSHNSTSNSRNLSASNDALLKPLKINDEITIIPQPASKMRNTSSSIKIESHVID